MWKDPIVEETRKRRNEYAKKIDHDVDAIFADIQKRQAEKSERLVSLPARKPVKVSDVA